MMAEATHSISQRVLLEETIERLIGLLDALTGDADLEPDADGEESDHGEAGGDDEPWLGWTETGSRWGGRGDWQGAFDGEMDSLTDQPVGCFDGSGKMSAHSQLRSHNIHRRYRIETGPVLPIIGYGK